METSIPEGLTVFAFPEKIRKRLRTGVASRNPRNFRNVELSGVAELFSAVIS
jgi:hypothetical protein